MVHFGVEQNFNRYGGLSEEVYRHRREHRTYIEEIFLKPSLSRVRRLT